MLTRSATQGPYPHKLFPEDGRGLGLRQNLERNNQVDVRTILASLFLSNIRKDGLQARSEISRSHLDRLCLKTTLPYRRSGS